VYHRLHLCSPLALSRTHTSVFASFAESWTIATPNLPYTSARWKLPLQHRS
jgi:hypothetical protein